MTEVSEAILDLKILHKVYGKRSKESSCVKWSRSMFKERTCFGLLGPNGAGKNYY